MHIHFIILKLRIRRESSNEFYTASTIVVLQTAIKNDLKIDRLSIEIAKEVK